MKKIISAIILASFTSTNIAYSQEKQVELPKVETPEGEVDPGEALSPMKINQKAPFSGVLLSPKASASITAKLNSIKEQLSLARSEAKETAEAVCKNEKNIMTIRTTADKDILSARIEQNQKIIQVYENRLEKVEESQTDPGLLIGLGALGGAALTVLTVFAVSQSIK